MNDRIQRFDYTYGDTKFNSDKLKTIELARIGTIADGSCWYHAFCRVTSPTYASLDFDMRRRFVKKIRRETAMLMTKDAYSKLHISDPNFSTYAEDKHIRSAHTLATYIASDAWMGEEISEFMSNLFKVDIIMLYYVDDAFGNCLTRALYCDLPNGKKYDRSIIIINIENNHFEGVGIVRNNRFYTIFDSDDPVIIDIKTKPIPFVRREDMDKKRNK